MRKIGFWALLAATVISGAIMAGCGGHVREPVTLSDQRFNGVFVAENINGTGLYNRFEFDGTSKCYNADEFNGQFDWTEIEVDMKNGRWRQRFWDDDAKWENDWTAWSLYRFRDDGSALWLISPEKMAEMFPDPDNPPPSVIISNPPESLSIWEMMWGMGYVKQ